MEIYREIKKERPKNTYFFCNIKLFVLCHSLLQFSQLLHSAYLKSCITTLEKRFGLNSRSSGTISSLHEVGNTVLIVFVSYFGSRVHRPRLIGLGGLLMSISAAMLTIPHFLSPRYKYDSALQGSQNICMLQANAGEPKHCEEEDATSLSANMWLLMVIAQLLFGVGSVPIQPFGLSFVDDFAGPRNAPLYIAILFAVSVFGPAFGYLLASVVLKIYVDVDEIDTASLELSVADRRWVGAWWIGLLVSSGLLALTSLPYFFFPRNMQAGGAVVDVFSEDPEKADITLLDFLKLFPRVIVRLMLSPIFLLLILAQCCFSSVIAGLSTFLNKFLECQYNTPASYSSLLTGAMNLPAGAIGMLLGGVILRRCDLSLKAMPRFSMAVILASTLLCVPLFLMGCSTQRVASVNWHHRGVLDGQRALDTCNLNCSCLNSTFNPVCGSDSIEHISPCHAGCINYTGIAHSSSTVQVYTNCSCVRDRERLQRAHPGHCANTCAHYLMPVVIIISVAGFVASLSHNPVYMMVLRTVPHEDKSFAIGIQFLLMRVLAWLPAPIIFGIAIDSTCIRWNILCTSKRGSCSYYDNDLLRNRYLGLQVGFKLMGIMLLALVGWKTQRMKEYSLEQNLEELL